MNDLCGYVPGKYTWPYKPILDLSDMGLDLIIYSTFDTNRFIESPESYLTERYGPEGCKANLENSDIQTVLSQAKDYLTYKENEKFSGVSENHTPSISKDLLNKGFLLVLWVNSKKLNKKEGFSGHFIMIHDYRDGSFIAHDCGGNDAEGNPVDQFPNRVISESDLMEACSPKEIGKTNIMIAIRNRK